MRLGTLHLGGDDVGLVDADEGGLDLFRFRLALADRGDEAVIDFARQQVLQRFAVAVGKGHDDHLVSHLGAVDEPLRLERRIVVLDRAQTLVEIGVRLGEGVDRGIGLGRRFPRHALARQRYDILGFLRRVLVARAARRIGIERRALVSGATAQHVAELEEDHNRRN